MAQESRLFITPEKGQTIFLDRFILTDLPVGEVSTTAEGLYPASGYHIGCDRSISLTRTDCEAVQKAQKEYFDFETQVKKRRVCLWARGNAREIYRRFSFRGFGENPLRLRRQQHAAQSKRSNGKTAPNRPRAAH